MAELIASIAIIGYPDVLVSNLSSEDSVKSLKSLSTLKGTNVLSQPINQRDGVAEAQTRTGKASAKGTHRSAVTNGTRLLATGDGRSLFARRLRDVFDAHVADLGGVEATSEAERSIVRRAALLTVQLEQMEAAFAEAKVVKAADLDGYQRAANSLRRLLQTVGLKRRPRDTTPDLRTYIEGAAA